MILADKNQKLIELITENTIKTKDQLNEYNPKEALSLLNKLVFSSKTDDKKDLYNCSSFDMMILCLCLSNNEKSFQEFKEQYTPIKSIINSIGIDKMEIINKLVNALNANNESKIDDCLQKLDLLPYKYIFGDDDLNIVFKPILVLESFKIGYAKTKEIKNYKAKKLAISATYQFTIGEFFKYFEQYKDSLHDREEYLKQRIKYNNEIKSILMSKEIEKLYPLKIEYLKYLSNDVLVDLLTLLCELLNTFYCDLEDKIEDLKNKVESNKLFNYFYSMGIIPESVDKKLVDELNEIDQTLLEKRTDFLMLLGLSPKDIFLNYNYYLKNLDSDIIDKVTFFIHSNIISRSLIINKISDMSKIFSKINTNYEVLKPIIDFSNVYYDDSILLEDLTSLKNKISILAEYNLSKNNYMYLLCNYDFINIYDLMLENEIPLYLLINICQTENPLLTIKRILLFKELNIPYETPTHLLTREVRYEKYFVCSNEELNTYHPDNMLDLPYIKGTNITDIKEDDNVKRLEEESRVDDFYLIGDTIISRPKLLKNLQLLKDNNELNNNNLLSAYLSDSLYTPSNILDVKTELNIEKSYLI